MKDMYFKMKKEAKERADNFRQEIRESKHGLLKIVGIELLPIAMGLTLGGLGRATGNPWIPVVPLGMDLVGGPSFLSSGKGLLELVKYGLGVALPYVDKLPEIYSLAEDLANKL
jgi:hypothetical protein